MLSYHATRSPPGSGIQAQVASSSSVLASPHGQPSGYSGQGSRRNDLLEGFQERNEYTTRNSINAVTKKVTELADSMVVASALRDLAGGASSVTNTPALAVAAGAFYPLAQPFSPYQSSATMTERALRAHLFLSLSTPSLAHLHATRTMAAEYGSSMFDQSAAQQGMMQAYVSSNPNYSANHLLLSPAERAMNARHPLALEDARHGLLNHPAATFVPTQALDAARMREDNAEKETAPSRTHALRGARGTNYGRSFDQGSLPHYSARTCLPLAGDDDENWLSDYLCFTRLELLEVFEASLDDVADRGNGKNICHKQVGIRCRFCAHLPYKSRVRRSSCFPSSLDRIYQSLTMMLREHLGQCEEMPEDLKERFLKLKENGSTPGTTDAKAYWKESAMKLGMVETQHGLMMDQGRPSCCWPVQREAEEKEGAGVGNVSRGFESEKAIPSSFLISHGDRKSFSSEYLFVLMSQAQTVVLTEADRGGARKKLAIGTKGFGCWRCCASNRSGNCRFFATDRRTLCQRINAFHDHLQRCKLCPRDLREQLANLKQPYEEHMWEVNQHKYVLDLIWARVHDGERSAKG